jgi:hypothetical protein
MLAQHCQRVASALVCFRGRLFRGERIAGRWAHQPDPVYGVRRFRRERIVGIGPGPRTTGLFRLARFIGHILRGGRGRAGFRRESGLGPVAQVVRLSC